MFSRTSSVLYKKKVSDGYVPRMLEAFAAALGRDIVVHSGDRKFVPTGGSTTSHHLDGRAADFHVAGLSDAKAFAALLAMADRLPTLPDQRFDLIYHGPYTQTEGEHLHLGHFKVLQKHASPWSITFRTEGLVPSATGTYAVVGHSTSKGFPSLNLRNGAD